MENKFYPQSQTPIRRTVELLPSIFKTEANDKFLSAVVDPLIQPGVLQKLSGYVGRRYGKTYLGKDIYLDSDNTLRSRYQLEPGVLIKNDNGGIEKFYDYIDFKNQLKFFGNNNERDDLITAHEHYSWNPPKHCDKFVNYGEYYWVPEGPPSVPVFGATQDIISEYSVKLGTGIGSQSSYIFNPDNFTNNPTLTLFRGQTYRFKVNAPKNGFSIRRNYDRGSLIYNNNLPYSINQLVVYDEALWQAKTNMPPLHPVFPQFGVADWEYVDVASSENALDYNDGVGNNNVENGYLEFKVPLDAPDTLFYQSVTDPNKFGRFIIADVESNTFIDVEKEIVGKSNYTSSNGVEFTSGLVVEFRGNVTPEKYARDTWLVENVGVEIHLVRFSDLVVPKISTGAPEILFDNEGFDTFPFDDATAYPSAKDYITISRDSADRNPWSRYNRWFPREVLDYAYQFRGQEYPAPENMRAKRPIFEFLPNLQLFNHCSIAKETVDYIDDYTTDIFSTIEGSLGYNIDGEELFEGARVLFTADTDSLANNRIYEVQFITHNGRRQIHLSPTEDSESKLGEGVLIRRGVKYSGLMFHYNGTAWVRSQEKTGVNQAPLFDVFDANGVSFGDPETYPVSTFKGCEIVGYIKGTGPRIDPELGFPLSYLNIDNVGDIEFHFNWDTDTFTYTIDRVDYTKKVATGFYRLNPLDEFGNCWVQTTLTYTNPILDSVKVTTPTNIINFTTVDWSRFVSDNDYTIRAYLNGLLYQKQFERTPGTGTFTFEDTFAENDVISIKLICDLEPNTGYYQIPVGLEKNPLNAPLSSWTLGQAIDHLNSALDFNKFFQGVVPGVTNLRDIPIDEFGLPYNTNGTRYLHHSGLAPLAVTLLCDKTNNIIKSIQYAERSYTRFKNNFLEKATTIEFNDNIVNMVDDIIAELTKTKNSDSAFADSDMIGSGAYTSIEYVVDDIGIKTFSLSEPFNLETLSRRAVYVYINNQQLLNKRDYTFNSTFGFVTLLVDLELDDVVVIREYLSTSSNFIPPTPTSMGLYKKYTPMKFLDDTYVEPRMVIQGHDGSITTAFGDFRDDLLLELEYRIYNNIKLDYNPNVFDIDKIVGGYYGNGVFNKVDIDPILSQEFLKWIQNTNINYTVNSFIDTENSFTYTYSNMTDPTGQINLPGYWRGVYQWFYDTDRPHRCPWEMLGFSEQPDWWEKRYGPAPYTRNNLILWEDLRDGIIREGERAGTYERYKRPTLMEHIPTDGNGNLLSPLDSGLANDFTLVNNKGNFVLGDIGPVEYAWRSSSEYPYAVIIAMCLLRPFEFIPDSFDRSRTKLNIIGQTIYEDTDLFVTIEDLVTPFETGNLSSGLIKYLVDYSKYQGLPVPELFNKIKNIDVRLSNRLSGFVNQNQHRYLLDSKNPRATTSGIFVPPENYDIIFNVSTPIAGIAYSGVLIEKVDGGWQLSGYDDLQPYFNYYAPLESQGDPLISVGGVSESFTVWTTNKGYNNGQIVEYNNDYFRALKTHTSGEEFDSKLWKRLPALPLTGAVEAFRRKTFNKLKTEKLSYGTILTSIQAVVNFLLGYESYLIDQGFVFNGYDTVNGIAQDWTTSCREFMFWTRHNWSNGSLITLSPAAQKIDLTVPVGVAESLLDGFYDYQLLKSDGKPLEPQYINVNRSFQNITIEPTNTTEGIYYVKVYYVLKEHVAIFDDRTVFNDVMYDKPTGYRQERVKIQSYRTTDWDGDYTSPGFLFDNVNIQVWQPYTDYKLGDIVAYRSYYWTSLSNQLGTETFDTANWSKLDSTPSKQLVANFDYKIKQFEDYFETNTDGISENQRALARHTVGYQTRDYLQNLSEDPVTQFQLYQGFIREKGSANAITKVFGKLSRSGDASIVLNEEWAFRVGKFGGVDQLKEIELNLDRGQFEINPQPILITSAITGNELDQYYRLNQPNFTVEPIPFTLDVNPTSVDAEPVKTAGYVKLDQVEFTVSNRDNILELDVTEFVENNHVWVTFEKSSWTVLRYNESALLTIVDLEKTGTSVLVRLDRIHNYAVGDIVGIKSVTNLTGFFKITAVTADTFTVTVDATAENPVIDDSSLVKIGYFTEARLPNYEAIPTDVAAALPQNATLWVDNNGHSRWEVIKKQQQYASKTLLTVNDYGVTDPRLTGSKVLYDDVQKQVIASIPGSGYVIVYAETPSGLTVKQIIDPPIGFEGSLNQSYGLSMALSPDSRFLVIGAPLASNIKSNYQGSYNPNAVYTTGTIVQEYGKLWTALNDVVGDGSTINLLSNEWEPTKLIEATQQGTHSGYIQQGIVVIYEYVNQRWQLLTQFVSPRPDTEELFGSAITIGQSGNTYNLAISAPGALNDLGRVYLYYYNGTEWSHQDNHSYRGIYSAGEKYPAGSIVWYNSRLFQALRDVDGDGSTIGVESGADSTTEWSEIGATAVYGALPTTAAYEFDDSSVYMPYNVNRPKVANEADLGILSTDQLVEFVKPGDGFGTSIAMNRDGSILVVGVPNSDGQYFDNYRGLWTYFTDYRIGDVVKVGNSYFELLAYTNEDSYASVGEDPTLGAPWSRIISDKENVLTGKVFVYQRSAVGSYDLKQTITSDSIDSTIAKFVTGDQFGSAVDLDYTGYTLVISSPKADLTNAVDQGAVYVFSTLGFAPVNYTLMQKLESFETYPNEYFGQSVVITSNADKIVVGARNTPVGTQGYTGGVYVFELKSNTYFMTEKLTADLLPLESFGYSIDATRSSIVVGSPDYLLDNNKIGIVRLFKKDENVNPWEILSTQQPVVNIKKIKSVSLYDDENNLKIQDVDYVDHAKLKVLNIAEQEIKFKVPFDPAVYTIGTNDQIVDPALAWAEKHVGEVWWDISTAKWIYYEQGEIEYRVGNWNTLAEGASIDVYEWVESLLLPSEWAALADTNEGFAEGISGQPLHPNDDVMTVKILYNESTGAATETRYYYWVKGSTITPNNPFRRISTSSITSLITSPISSGLAFIALIDSNKFLTYNFTSVISTNYVLLNIQYLKNDKPLNAVHNEYQLLTEGDATSLPTGSLESKWIDSLVGADSAGNRVPDINLTPKQTYGLSFRPRQTMFVDRLNVLKIAITYINDILKKEAFADIINFNNLNSVDSEPFSGLNLYDVTVDTEIDLQTVGTTRVKQAVLNVNIVDGRIDTIDVVEPGYGYKVVPPIEFEGDGTGAKAEATLDVQGRIVSVTVISRGRKYSTAIAKVRNFSVLVKNDSTANNFWSIYAWDDTRKVFFRTATQAFDTTRYWSLADWWKSGYGPTSRIVKEINNLYEYPTITTIKGDLIRIKEYAGGGWAVFERQTENNLIDGVINLDVEDFSIHYTMVGRQKGTIELSSNLYITSLTGIGYDNVQPFDITTYDITNNLELRNILKAVKEDIFVGDYAVEWNKLFFVCIREALAEQPYVDWVFKTSFLNAIHNVGAFEQKLTYRSDNLDSFQEYINEVKPYRTTVREYVSRYDTLESYGSDVSDFDLQPTYSVVEGKIVPMTETNELINTFPWVSWKNFHTYSVVSIKVYDAGSNYQQVPKVLIEGDGTGAEAQAYISNGRVSGIKVTNSGSGYTYAPRITLVGGTSSSANTAKASAVIGNTKARTFGISLKFDRIDKIGTYVDLSVENEVFYGNGFTASFELKYAPTRDKSKITIYKNNQLLLNSEYSISLYTSTTDTYSLLKGKLILMTIPDIGDEILVSYEKNDELLDSVNRIEKYYAPTTGMKGKGKQIETKSLISSIIDGTSLQLDSTFNLRPGMRMLVNDKIVASIVEVTSEFDVIVSRPQTLSAETILTFEGYDFNQLMTGIDFGGVLIQGTTFEVTGGWDALPWFTDNWDSVESSADHYVICDGSTTTVTLPYIPAAGQQITIYLKRSGSYSPATIDDLQYSAVVQDTPIVRIDDPNYINNGDSSIYTNPNALMPTFVGDGINAVIEIGQYVRTESGDTLIFRPIESDGSVTITDPNLLDTKLSGGTLENINQAYTTANGLSAEDISIDGGKFISPEQVPATEENVPGQVLESLSIKVYNSTVTGSAPLHTSTIVADGFTRFYNIGVPITESNSVLVYVNKVRVNLGNTANDYAIDLVNNQIEFFTAPANRSIVEIIAIGIGGVSVLDYQEFIADGVTSQFLTQANYADTVSVFATVNGNYQLVGFVNSSEELDIVGKTLVELTPIPSFGSVVKLVCLGSSNEVDVDGLSIVRVNRAEFFNDGSSAGYTIPNFKEFENGSAISSMLVEINDVALKGVDTVYETYDGTNNQIVIGIDPEEIPGTILPGNLRVFVNGELKTYLTDYVYTFTTNTVTIDTSILTIGDIIKIENDFRAQYRIDNSTLTLTQEVLDTYQNNDDSTLKDTITVTWFSSYPSMDIVSDEYIGGQVQYKLRVEPLSISYVWVYKNGIRLTANQDYSVSLPRSVLYLKDSSTKNDSIKIIVFGSQIRRKTSAFEIHKDMVNVYRYNRYSSGSIKLSKELNYYDQEIVVNDATELFTPVANKNISGMIEINGERIEYLQKSGNTLSQLRRGVNGTPIGLNYSAGSSVVDVGPGEYIPYVETQDRQNFVSDGSSFLIGPLNFVPSKGTRTSTWTRNTIPNEYGPCDQIEVFVGGRRLRKDPISIYNELNGSSSPAADEIIEAEFSVDGVNYGTTESPKGFIRLTNPVPAGVRIFVIRRTGKIWYDRGDNTVTTGVTLLDNNTPIANFIVQKTTDLPE